MPFSISYELTKTLNIARCSYIPVLLIGKQGIGKSEFLTEYANILEFELTILDLSLLRREDFTDYSIRPNLLNLPDSNSSKEHILVVKKLNQCSQDIQKLALQLLINRQFHTYRLPRNTFLVACMTTSDEGHSLSTIDPSMLSRFLTIPLKTDLKSWLIWSRNNDVHPIIQDYVQKTLFPFEKISPRTYVRISHILNSMDYYPWGRYEINSVIELILGDSAEDFISFMEKWGCPHPDKDIYSEDEEWL